MPYKDVKLEIVSGVSAKTGRPYEAYIIHTTRVVAGKPFPAKSARLFTEWMLDLDGAQEEVTE